MNTPVNLEKEFVPFTESLELKELGFDEPCILLYRGLDMQPVCQMDYEFKTEKNSDYNDETNYWLTVPTYSQAFRWFREKFILDYCIVRLPENGVTEDSPKGYACYVSINLNGNSHLKNCDTYFEAELVCLRKLIEIVKNK